MSTFPDGGRGRSRTAGAEIIVRVGSSDEVARLGMLVCNVGISNLLNLELVVSGFALKSDFRAEGFLCRHISSSPNYFPWSAHPLSTCRCFVSSHLGQMKYCLPWTPSSCDLFSEW